MSDIVTPYASEQLLSAYPRMRTFWQRHRTLMVCTALSLWIPGALYSAILFKPTFQSSASVLIKDSAIKAAYVTSDPMETTSAPSANPVLNTLELLKSPIIRDALWTKLLADDPKLRDALGVASAEEWQQFYKDGTKLIKFKNPPGTDVISLTFAWDDPTVAQKGMAIVLDGFQQASRELNQHEYRERSHYLAEQIATVQRRLSEVRTRITAIQQRNQVIDIDQQLQEYARYHLQFKMESALAQAEASKNQRRLSAYQQTMGMSPEQAVRAVGLGQNPTMQRLYEALYHQQQELSQLQSRYTDVHPRVIKLTAAVQETQANIAREAKRFGIEADTVAVADDSRGKSIEHMVDAKSDALGASQKSRALTRDLKAIEARMRVLPQVRQTLSQLQDTETALSESLRSLESKAVDAKLREDQTLSNVFVIVPPELPQSPKAPTRLHMLVATLLAGILGAVGAANARDYFSRKPRTLAADPTRNGTSYPGRATADYATSRVN